MPVVINLNKSDSSVPWGFRLHGGKDFGAPLTVQRINPGSVAAKCGLQIGDAISVIDSVSTSGLKHKDAQDLIVKGGNSLQLTIFRGGEIPVRQIEASDPYVPFVVEKPSFKQTGESTISPEYSLSSQVGSISISSDKPSSTPSFSAGAVPFKPAPISSKNASLYQPSLQTITSGLVKSSTDSVKESDDFPPPPPFPAAISPTPRSFAASTGGAKLHQPTQRYPEIVLNEEPVNGTKSSDNSQYVPSETYKLVKDMERGLDVPFNPKTGAGVRASPIQSKLVDILEKKHATLENDRFQEDTTPRVMTPQAPPSYNAPIKNLSYGTNYRKNSQTGPLGVGKFSGGGGSTGHRSPSPQPPSKSSLIDQLDPTAIPICNVCKTAVRGAYVMAINKIWCPDHFLCSHPSCRRNLSETGFVEEQGQLYCKEDYERYFAPRCAKCNKGILGNTVKALKSAFHPECFTCHQCNQSILGGSFHLHEGNIYCDKDFAEFFSAKCLGCNFPIEVGDNWIEAVGTNWHGECFNCAVCRMNLQNTGFVHKEGRFLCKDHAKSQY